MGPFIDTVTPDDVPAVDLSKPGIRTLGLNGYVPAVGTEVYVTSGARCGRFISGDSGSCYMPKGHDRATVPCVGVSLVRYGDTGYLTDVFRVDRVDALYVPLTEDQAIALTNRATAAEMDAEQARKMIADIREYVLERRAAGDICDAGTLRFLLHFGLDTWERPFRMSYTVTFDIDALSEDNAETVAQGMLDQALGWRSDFVGTDVEIEHRDTTDLEC